MEQLITPQLVSLDVDLGAGASDVIEALAAQVVAAGRAGSVEELADAAKAREALAGTGVPGGIAIPHCRTATVTAPTLAFARLTNRADFGAPDGPADIVFMIAAPEGAGNAHLKLLSSLARALVRADFTQALRDAQTPDDVIALVEDATSGVDVKQPAPAAPAPAEDTTTTEAPRRRVVAVTACTTGIAHTYMAADALAQAAGDAQVDFAVEPQGSSGVTPLTAEQIAAADAVIFATDVGVKDQSRFAGKPVIRSGVKRAINEPAKMIDEALAAASDPNARRVEGDADASAGAGAGDNDHVGKKLQRWLLTGVSYMIPFVAAGGLMIALGFLLAGYDITDTANEILATNSLTNLPAAGDHALFDSAFLYYVGALVYLLGSWAFSFLVPALAGYIAYAIADRPGIAPGFVMGYAATQIGVTETNQSGAGFLGGIIGGLLAGLVAAWFASRPVPRWLAGLMPVVIIPLVSTLVVGMAMILVLAKPLAWLNEALVDGLNGMTGGSAIVLGGLLGLMMCVDLGGPVNKAAYVFAVTGLSTTGALDPGSSQSKIMAAVMLAGMVPPLAMALSTALRPKLYAPAERENGKAAWLLGASFISEGAIPFAAADPFRVLPAMMAGGVVTGAMSMALGVTCVAPHGGVFVFFAVDNVLWFFVSLIVGTLVAGFLVTALKQVSYSKQAAETADEPVTV
ncbi:PTS fructose transporter subunit IIABC [Aeromicrobium choanae]|uniref:PTS system D-fructose-specific IIA component (F1P-forming), Frc family /PTS system D-fructose-specific IIB component (F1P-forming), Frc family /PTS system D-fructose-specific IIC component (F1P-for... n=1 Tax=Aeromicrobium choanae TaxID=1736691 RepID=A0A1T4Z033_9ACTN|nr:fructose-specific PTS transporter subunit EIIC [Aeromicrobium choanae]SKB07384.1 PTS system D-fructose-specific IIA component (F1P-forming), Frc family /PTS system D-fructose-specific IIB component (F1P-forming), Frc family /PTS system D-fructose-specific IIC component (F1P-forming), Frc family [Aeromicrobium choanae]